MAKKTYKFLCCFQHKINNKMVKECKMIETNANYLDSARNKVIYTLANKYKFNTEYISRYSNKEGILYCNYKDDNNTITTTAKFIF